MERRPNQGAKRWLVLLVAGILLFVGGGGTGYMLGQQQAKTTQAKQMKKGPQGMNGKRPSGQPSDLPSQSSSSK
ncbi:hypothetical protein [Levilactobacillus namurensis]|uniref:hypothetical protein n=1 Tax=Levilactobacillus namurensis TaxID=380393 RepID=UPI002230CEDA|nr:hypothetical protein [Levilactobacillus namurensis]MCW3779366.1 hypothetical protein [Levilactobacillus namurensis]MDT7017778.1 hypothetical protein [Levilactobacillus namurensis]WNN65221.1 hypothetical protein RIN67_11110 [Levilactobacillus namurensis]